MHIETERKFLVKDLSFKDLAVTSYEIRQGYIAHDGGNTVRVRIRDKQGFLTIKGPSVDGISRHEWEREIPLEDAQELFLLCRGGTPRSSSSSAAAAPSKKPAILFRKEVYPLKPLDAHVRMNGRGPQPEAVGGTKRSEGFQRVYLLPEGSSRWMFFMAIMRGW